jgi:hypothetical protein
MTLSAFIVSLISLSINVAPLAADLPAGPTLSAAPPAIADGQVSLLQIVPSAALELPSDVAAKAGDTPITLFPCLHFEHARCALVPVPVGTAPGVFSVNVTWGPPESRQSKTVEIQVRKAKYQHTILKVDPDRVHPNPEEQKRIDEEKKEMDAAYAQGSPQPLWREPMAQPAGGAVTSRFGNRRSFNGELKSIHFGEDRRAKMRTPIPAIDDGKIVLAKELFYAGNVVIVDHGAGIFSSYAHLSEIRVAVGQDVKKGALLGLSGKTGRVTGPHLHFAVRANGSPVDPEQALMVFNQMWE